LWAVNCHIEASNTEFSNASEFLVMLAGGKYQFTHCTMANYMQQAMMSHKTTRFVQTLTLADNINTHTFPLQQAYFDNCIIDGNLSADTLRKYSGELFFSTDKSYLDGNDEQFNYRFNHCLIKTKKVDNNRFREVLFIDNNKYIKSEGKNEDNKYDYIYDFRLAKESPGIGKADRSIAEQYPTDRYGINRLTSEPGPSIGAYEYLPQDEK